MHTELLIKQITLKDMAYRKCQNNLKNGFKKSNISSFNKNTAYETCAPGKSRNILEDLTWNFKMNEIILLESTEAAVRSQNNNKAKFFQSKVLILSNDPLG